MNSWRYFAIYNHVFVACRSITLLPQGSSWRRHYSSGTIICYRRLCGFGNRWRWKGTHHLGPTFPEHRKSHHLRGQCQDLLYNQGLKGEVFFQESYLAIFWTSANVVPAQRDNSDQEEEEQEKEKEQSQAATRRISQHDQHTPIRVWQPPRFTIPF